MLRIIVILLYKILFYTVNMNNASFRVLALLLHILASLLILFYVLDFDLSGGWIRFFLFIALCMLLLVLLITHFVSFIRFFKTKS